MSLLAKRKCYSGSCPRLPTRFSAAAFHKDNTEDMISAVESLQSLRHHLAKDSKQGLWNDRLALQSLWTLQEKGWRVAVEWKETQHCGVGVFATEPVRAGSVLRVGRNGRNLIQFKDTSEILAFCGAEGNDEYRGRLAYVQDYLWGFNPTHTDQRGYPTQQSSSDHTDSDFHDERFFGMWLPGNGLNHSTTPNTVYQALAGGTEEGIALLALVDIAKGHELYDDYRRHGSAPIWLKDFARTNNVTLNFSDCNDFVVHGDISTG
jgi:SET domain